MWRWRCCIGSCSHASSGWWSVLSGLLYIVKLTLCYNFHSVGEDDWAWFALSHVVVLLWHDHSPFHLLKIPNPFHLHREYRKRWLPANTIGNNSDTIKSLLCELFGLQKHIHNILIALVLLERNTQFVDLDCCLNDCHKPLNSKCGKSSWTWVRIVYETPYHNWCHANVLLGSSLGQVAVANIVKTLRFGPRLVACAGCQSLHRHT